MAKNAEPTTAFLSSGSGDSFKISMMNSTQKREERKKKKKDARHVFSTTHPIIQAPPVTKATTGFGPLLFFGK